MQALLNFYYLQILLDEVGRGTSSNEGLAIALAITSHLLMLKSRTIFATHYHSLPDLLEKYGDSKLLDSLASYRIEATKDRVGDHFITALKES